MGGTPPPGFRMHRPLYPTLPHNATHFPLVTPLCGSMVAVGGENAVGAEGLGRRVARGRLCLACRIGCRSVGWVADCTVAPVPSGACAWGGGALFTTARQRPARRRPHGLPRHGPPLGGCRLSARGRFQRPQPWLAGGPVNGAGKGRRAGAIAPARNLYSTSMALECSSPAVLCMKSMVNTTGLDARAEVVVLCRERGRRSVGSRPVWMVHETPMPGWMARPGALCMRSVLGAPGSGCGAGVGAPRTIPVTLSTHPGYELATWALATRRHHHPSSSQRLLRSRSPAKAAGA